MIIDFLICAVKSCSTFSHTLHCYGHKFFAKTTSPHYLPVFLPQYQNIAQLPHETCISSGKVIKNRSCVSSQLLTTMTSMCWVMQDVAQYDKSTDSCNPNGFYLSAPPCFASLTEPRKAETQDGCDQVKVIQSLSL